jgi:16S rRNA (uracil1498-N3)-methyltransferase
VTPLTARAHVFVDDLAAPRLSDADHHHVARVLRLSVGAEVTVGDGAGGWRPARLTDGPAVVPTGAVVDDPRADPPITVAFALVKGERPEWTVQKLTELGVDRIVPFAAERGVVRWDAAKADRQASRFADIARQAAMQCRRTRLPRVDRLATFAEVAALDGAAMADPDGGPPSLAHPTVLVGPEGGWSPGETAADLPLVRLGSYILRAETAAVTAGGLLVALRGNLLTQQSD